MKWLNKLLNKSDKGLETAPVLEAAEGLVISSQVKSLVESFEIPYRWTEVGVEDCRELTGLQQQRIKAGFRYRAKAFTIRDTQERVDIYMSGEEGSAQDGRRLSFTKDEREYIYEEWVRVAKELSRIRKEESDAKKRKETLGILEEHYTQNSNLNTKTTSVKESQINVEEE